MANKDPQLEAFEAAKKKLLEESKQPTKANDIQYGGSHYKSQVIQPWDYIARNKIPYLEGSAIKYISRWRDKGGIEDLKKAIHFIEKVIELESEVRQASIRISN